MRLFSNPAATAVAVTESEASLPMRRAQAWLEPRLKRGESERFIETVSLTPQLAELLLRLNTHNRHPSKDKQARFIRIQQEGRWRLVQQGMSVSKERVLLDGQNRCMSVVASGCTIPMHIEFGCEPEEMEVIDTGVPRSAIDVAQLAGMDNAALRIAITRLLYMIQTREMGTIDPQRARIEAEKYADSPEMARAIKAAGVLNKGTMRGINPAPAGLAFYLLATKSRKADRLEEFWHNLVTGEGASKVVLKLRDKALSRQITAARTTREKSIKQCAAIILTWNAYLKGARSADTSWARVVELPEVE